jgi:hypothetical protein
MAWSSMISRRTGVCVSGSMPVVLHKGASMRSYGLAEEGEEDA